MASPELHLIRLADQGVQTIGRLRVLATGPSGEHELLNLATLELPWRGNARGVSCIPEGRYRVTHRGATRAIPHTHLFVHDVPGRSGICIHAGNYHRHTMGCPLVGLSHRDINNDGYVDVVSSRVALSRLLALVPQGGAWLTVTFAQVQHPLPVRG